MKYKHLRLWNYELGAKSYYTDQLVEQAIKENAPANAIYKTGNTWRTFDECPWAPEEKTAFEARMNARYKD